MELYILVYVTIGICLIVLGYIICFLVHRNKLSYFENSIGIRFKDDFELIEFLLFSLLLVSRVSGIDIDYEDLYQEFLEFKRQMKES